MEEKVETFDFSPEQILFHAKKTLELHKDNCGYAKRYLQELIENSGFKDSADPFILQIWNLIEDIEDIREEHTEHEGNLVRTDSMSAEKISKTQKALELASKEISFRKELEEYFLPKQLVDAVFELGEIPKNSEETTIGIGFIDIADYTYLSKFLSPMENQAVLNGLYTAFSWVLKRHGGYLNKIEGDSMMFHFGGLLDPKVRLMEEQEVTRYISKELFYTCVEMQRVCALFNQANDKFIYGDVDPATKETLKRAFEIISMLRNNQELSSAMNALFQIRIRIGANLGQVTIGSFGPDGAKQWDVIGLPVIDAKRMESTAPIGGLRISESFYEVLRDTGVVDAYYKRLRREASAMFGYYRAIKQEDLFKLSKVILKDKKNAEFITYSIQVNPALPEDLAKQTELLLEKGETGADKIIEFLEYYRGNKYVIQAIEDVFSKKNITVRKDNIIKAIYPKKYKAFLGKLNNVSIKVWDYINENYSLFNLLEKLGEYQDKMKGEFAFNLFQLDDTPVEYVNYELYMKKEIEKIKQSFQIREKSALQKMYFYNLVYPLVFKYIRSSILEYQNRTEDLEEL